MASSSGLWNMVLPEPTKVQKACDGAEVHLKAGLNAKNNSRRKVILSEAGLKYLYIALGNGVSYFYLYFCWKIEGVEKEGYFKSDKHSVFFPCYSMHCECTSCLIPGSPACILFHTLGSLFCQSQHIPICSLLFWIVSPFWPNVWFKSLKLKFIIILDFLL